MSRAEEIRAGVEKLNLVTELETGLWESEERNEQLETSLDTMLKSHAFIVSELARKVESDTRTIDMLIAEKIKGREDAEQDTRHYINKLKEEVYSKDTQLDNLSGQNKNLRGELRELDAKILELEAKNNAIWEFRNELMQENERFSRESKELLETNNGLLKQVEMLKERG